MQFAKIIKDVKFLIGRIILLPTICKIAIDEKPDALFFKSRNYSDIKAEVCGDCGYIAFCRRYILALGGLSKMAKQDMINGKITKKERKNL